MSEGKKSYAVLHFRKSKELVGLNLNPKHSQNVNHTKKKPTTVLKVQHHRILRCNYLGLD